MNLTAELNRQKYRLVLSVALLLAFFTIRISNLESIPFFVDEVIVVNIAERIPQTGILLDIWEGRPLTSWSLIPFQTHLTAPILTTRVVILIYLLPSFACFLWIARQMSGWLASALFSALFLFSPYHDFFQRFALADTLSILPLTIAFTLSWRWRNQLSINKSLFIGFLLSLAFLTKISNVIFFAIPFFASISAKKLSFFTVRKVALYLVGPSLAVLLSITYYVVASWRGYDMLTMFQIHAVNDQVLSVSRFLQNIMNTFESLNYYLTLPLTVILILSIMYMIKLKKQYLYLNFMLPMTILWLGSAQQSRFWQFPVTIGLLCMALMLVNLMTLQKRIFSIIILGSLIFWIAFGSFPFLSTARKYPAELSIPQHDSYQYLRGESSGLTFEEIKSTLNSREPQLVLGIINNCLSLRYLSLSDFPVHCPRVNYTGEDIPQHIALMEENRSRGVYAVLDSTPFTPSEAPGMLITVIPSPDETILYSIYDLSP